MASHHRSDKKQKWLQLYPEGMNPYAREIIQAHLNDEKMKRNYHISRGTQNNPRSKIRNKLVNHNSNGDFVPKSVLFCQVFLMNKVQKIEGKNKFLDQFSELVLLQYSSIMKSNRRKLTRE